MSGKDTEMAKTKATARRTHTVPRVAMRGKFEQIVSSKEREQEMTSSDSSSEEEELVVVDDDKEDDAVVEFRGWLKDFMYEGNELDDEEKANVIGRFLELDYIENINLRKSMAVNIVFLVEEYDNTEDDELAERPLKMMNSLHGVVKAFATSDLWKKNAGGGSKGSDLWRGDISSDKRIDGFLLVVRKILHSFQTEPDQEVVDRDFCIRSVADEKGNFQFQAFYHMIVKDMFYDHYPSMVSSLQIFSNIIKMSVIAQFLRLGKVTEKESNALAAFLAGGEEVLFVDTMLHRALNLAIVRLTWKEIAVECIKQSTGSSVDMSLFKLKPLFLIKKWEDIKVYVMCIPTGINNVAMNSKNAELWNKIARAITEEFEWQPKRVCSLMSIEGARKLELEYKLEMKQRQVMNDTLVASGVTFNIEQISGSTPIDGHSEVFHEVRQANGGARLSRIISGTRYIFDYQGFDKMSIENKIDKMQEQVEFLYAGIRDQTLTNFTDLGGQLDELQKELDGLVKKEQRSRAVLKSQLVTSKAYAPIVLKLGSLSSSSKFCHIWECDMREALGNIQDYSLLIVPEQKEDFIRYAKTQTLDNMTPQLIICLGGRDQLFRCKHYDDIFKKVKDYFARDRKNNVDIFRQLIELRLDTGHDPSNGYLYYLDNRMKQLKASKISVPMEVIIPGLIANLNLDVHRTFQIRWAAACKEPGDELDLERYVSTLLVAYDDVKIAAKYDKRYDKSNGGSQSSSRSEYTSGSGRSDNSGKRHSSYDPSKDQKRKSNDKSINYTSGENKKFDKPKNETPCNLRVCKSNRCEFIHTRETHPDKFQ